jgi:hypothetical protein
MAKDNKTDETAETAAPVKAQQISEAEMAQIRENTGKALALQPKRSIRLPKLAHPKAPNYETVQINGYTYTIMRGVDVEVPDEVYQILNRAGSY